MKKYLGLILITCVPLWAADEAQQGSTPPVPPTMESPKKEAGQNSSDDAEAADSHSEAQVIENLDIDLDKKDGQKLGLEDCVRTAIQGASAVLKAQNDLSFSGTGLLQAYAQFLPNLVANGSYGYTTGRTYYTTATPTYVSGESKNAAYGLTATLNLFNGFSDFANWKAANHAQDASEQTLARVKQQISLDISQSFLQVILDQRIVQINKKNVLASRERERLLKEQTTVGARNLSDLFRQQAQTSLDESSLISAKNKTRTDEIILLRKLRVDVSSPYHFVEPAFLGEHPQVKLGDEKALVSQGLDKRLDLKASNNSADAQEWNVHMASSTYFPTLDLVGSMAGVGHSVNSMNVNGADGLAGFNQDPMNYQLRHEIQYGIGLSLTWNLFDRFVTAKNVSQARVAAHDARIDADDRKLQVEGEVRQAYGDYLTAIQQLRASKKGLEAAQKAYEVMDGRYGVGAASFLDLITAQTALVQAESIRAQALINFELQDKSLDFAVGTLATD